MQGKYRGGARQFGFEEKPDDEGKLGPIPEEQAAIVGIMKALREADHTLREIADALRAQGHAISYEGVRRGRSGGRGMSEEHPVTLDPLGELMLNLQADLQVVSATMLRLDRSMDRLREDTVLCSGRLMACFGCVREGRSRPCAQRGPENDCTRSNETLTPY